jgi:hypothetical protein
MKSHTSWYLAEDPPESMHLQQSPQMQQHRSYRQDWEEERPVSMPDMPFRLVISTGGAPYSLHEEQSTVAQSHIVDILSGERFQSSDPIRQPAAEEFLHLQPTFPAPKSIHLDRRRADPKRSKSTVEVLDATGSEPSEVHAMGADMFSPALGGLHRLPSAPPRRPSRLGRFKRFFSLKGRRQYGRATR